MSSCFYFPPPWIRQIFCALTLFHSVGFAGHQGPLQKEFHNLIAPKESDQITVNLDQAGFWCIELAQKGIDLKLTVKIVDSETWLQVDSPLDEWGFERLTVALEKPAQMNLTLTAQASNGAAGKYHLKVSLLGALHAKDLPLIQAEFATTRAGQLYAENNPKVWDQSLAAYQQEVTLRKQTKQTALEARATYCIGVLYRLLGKHADAQSYVDRALILQRQLNDPMAIGFTTNELGLLALADGKFEGAALWFKEAIGIRKQLGAPGLQAASQNNLCLTLLNQGRFEEAVPCLEAALELSAQAQRVSTQLSIHTNLGHLFDRLAQPSKARQHYQAALALQGPGTGWGKARLHNNLGAFYMRLSNFHDAFSHYFEALSLFRELGEKAWEARVLNNLGSAYIKLDQPERALPFLQTALPLRRSHGNKRGELVTLINLGLANESQGTLEKGLAYLKTAKTLAQEIQRPRDSGRANLALARILYQQKRLDESLAHVDQALGDLGGANFPAEIAGAYLAKGLILTTQDQPQLALIEFGKAEANFRQQEADDGLISTLYFKARAEMALNNIALAKETTAKAISMIESLRTSIPLEPMRRSFFARHHQVYTLMVELSLASPSHGELERWQALAWSERGKAREFLRIQQQAGRTFGRSKDGQRDELAITLGMEVQAKARMLEKLPRSGASASARDRASLALEQALFELDRHNHQTQRNFSRASAAYDLKSVQKKLGSGTQLLVYSLGESRSFVWNISSTQIQAETLPNRSKLEALALQAYHETAQISTSRSKGTKLSNLAHQILKPLQVSETLEKLIVVPDGSLHLIPFGVLPYNESSGRSLIQNGIEVTYLPSVTTLLTAKPQGKQVRTKPSLAIFADPVFQKSDSRFQEEPKKVQGSPWNPGEYTYGRLPASAFEAKAIQELAGPSISVKQYLGFKANLNQIFSDDLPQHQYLHFATHTHIDMTYPELSALVLSLLDPQGRAQPGHLRIHQFKDVPLGAELVVLSGCETAIGRAFRGEGLAGLARGFMHAGARQVVASLWPVPDQATALFMDSFYRFLLVEKLPASTALLKAQQFLQAKPQYRHPFYWGGWVLFGQAEAN